MFSPSTRPRGAALLVALSATCAAVAGDTAALERELLSDARTRPGFQSATAGHDGKFFLGSADGAMRLEPGALIQYRYVLDLRDSDEPDEDLSNGFDFRRAKLFVGGTVSPEIEYYIQGAFFCGEGDFRLEFAQFTHRFENGVGVMWGQFKLPFLQEELVSEKFLLAADRSVTHAVFTQGISQGVQLGYEADSFRLAGALSDGTAACNTTYYDPMETDVALTARAEMRLGEAPWKAYASFPSFRHGPAGAMLGAALHWQASGRTGNERTFAGEEVADADLLAYTLDATYKGGGWGLFGAFIGQHPDADGSPEASDFGALLQGTAFATEQVELFARWDAVFPDGDRDAGDDFHTLTLGANYYFVPGSFAARLTADVQWFLDDQAASGSLVKAPAATGLLPTDQEGEVCLRIQMQLLF